MSATTAAHIISYDPAAVQRWEALGAYMATAEPRRPHLPQHVGPRQAQQLRRRQREEAGGGGARLGRRWWQYRWFDSDEHEVMKQQQAFALAIYLTNSPRQAERES
jgi:hypothetical protein